MFGWRRKNDGFEWHKYVRTTIKLRRADRRAKLNEVKDIAADGMRQAGRAGVAAGSNGAIRLWNGALSAIQWVIAGAMAVGGKLSGLASGAVGPAGRRLASSLGAALAGAGRFLARLPVLNALSEGHRKAGAGVAAVALLFGGGYVASRHAPSLSALGNIRVFAPQIVEGKATVLSGDSLRINGSLIRLAGIEAPELDQKCIAGKKKWSCSEAAVTALQKLVRNKTVRCELSGSDAADRSLATCLTVNTGNSQDLAAVLVGEGAVFAESGLFAPYTTHEGEAKARKVGLWKGEAERPADYRARIWETAVKTAPDGCPIKGQVAGEAKIYVLPWLPSYSGARVRPARGERWFCSESEAQAAGWKMASR